MTVRALRNVSYRLKVPLAMSAVIVAVAAIVAAILGARIYADARTDLLSNAESLGRTLSRALTPIMLRDDVWQAYEAIMAPLGGEGAPKDPHRSITVVDADGRVYASSDPTRFPMLGSAAQGIGSATARLLERESGGDARVIEDTATDTILVAVTVKADDGARLGHVVLSYSRDVFLPRFFSTVRRVVLSTVVALAILLPLGWFFGRQLAAPLVNLEGAMARVGDAGPAEVTRGLHQGTDEIGRLNARFERMVHELEDKRRLEREMLAADRLAAIGRLTAGIAHEINNPLAGMLTAIDTTRKHGHPDAGVAKTLSLIERGLQQVRHTVSALLVEARLETRPLTADDINDVRTLLEPEAEARNQRLEWESDLTAPVSLPSTSIRQILINLVLNAIQAAGEDGNVSCRIAANDSALSLRVRNDGRTIPAEQLDHMFEPFASASGNGSGLGLWVTYQIVEQLRGTIQVRPGPPETEFCVALPVGAAA